MQAAVSRLGDPSDTPKHAAAVLAMQDDEEVETLLRELRPSHEYLHPGSPATSAHESAQGELQAGALVGSTETSSRPDPSAATAEHRSLTQAEAATVLKADPFWLLRPVARIHEGVELLSAPEAARAAGVSLEGDALLASAGVQELRSERAG